MYVDNNVNITSKYVLYKHQRSNDLQVTARNSSNNPSFEENRWENETEKMLMAESYKKYIYLRYFTTGKLATFWDQFEKSGI